MTPEEQLRVRPSFETAAADYITMLDEMRTELSRLVPTLEWDTAGSAQEGSALCREPFTDIEPALVGGFTSGSATGSIPDQTWPAALKTLTEIAARYGFTDVVVIVDKPGHHVVSFYDEYVAEVQLGTKLDTTLDVYGACFIAEHEETLNDGATPLPASPSPSP